MKHLNKPFKQVAYVGLMLAVLGQSAWAAGASTGTRDTLNNVFLWIYSCVGVIGGITLLVHIVNAKAGNFLGSQDPRKSIVNTIIYLALAFAVVGIVQTVKAWVGSSGGDIGSL